MAFGAKKDKHKIDYVANNSQKSTEFIKIATSMELQCCRHNDEALYIVQLHSQWHFHHIDSTFKLLVSKITFMSLIICVLFHLINFKGERERVWEGDYNFVFYVCSR